MTKHKRLPFLAITLGDPAGIGPHVAAAAARDSRVLRRCRPVLVGDAWVLRRFLRPASLAIHPIAHLDDYQSGRATVNVLHVAHPRIGELVLGRPQRVAGESASLAIKAAVGLAMQGRVAAVVTGPVSKESFKLAGLPYPGHTEMLAALSGVRRVEMLMVAGGLKTVLITRHLPLKEVSSRLSVKSITDAVQRTDPWLKKLSGGRGPRWVVCGLNPHAGDNGLLGREEKTTVAPAVAALRRRGIKAEGPLPADVAWARHAAGDYDAVACLYHDQGMIPLKALFPKQVVNITVGLPWVRTSPGHGTAFDLASGPRPFAQADATPTVEAALWALRIGEKFKGGK